MRSRFLTIVLLVGLLSLVIVPAANADLPANLSWVKYASNPVVISGKCTVATPARPAVLVKSANTYNMYYTTHPGTAGAEIYLATTTDGGLTWTCNTPTNPVLQKGAGGAWDENRVIAPTVIWDGGTSYEMWYTGRNNAGTYGIGYATSTDGINWAKYGSNPLTSMNAGAAGAWDSQIVREPAVAKTGDTSYHMWYSGTARWPYFKIGHATSTDGINWTKDANPVLIPTAGSWDANEVYAPSVVYSGGKFDMFYSGNAGSVWLTGHARSDNGTVWTKDANAIISPEGGSAWDKGDSTDYVAGVLDGSTWKVFYSGAGAAGYQIGLATLKNEPQLTLRPLATNISVGGTTDVYIDLTAATSLYGYQFAVNYGAKVNAIAAAFESSFFNPAEGFIAWNADYTTTSGMCKFAVTKKLGLGTAVSGSGALAKITLQGVTPGPVQLTFSSDILANQDGGVLAHSKTVGWLDVYGTATLSGVVNLQGRANRVDPGTVTVYDGSGYYPPVSVPFSATDGTWTAVVPVGSGSCDILAAHGLYLSNLKTGVAISSSGPYPQPTTTLKGGDADNSGKIEVNDLTCIGGAFGGPPTVCGTSGSNDINADGTVNILDLVLAGGNYDLASPQAW